MRPGFQAHESCSDDGVVVGWRHLLVAGGGAPSADRFAGNAPTIGVAKRR